MQIMKNNKGMTLIEVIVVLLLMAIVLVIAGNILLSSIGFFQKTGDARTDQQALQTLADYTRSEILYASEVIVDTKKPDGDNWHKISINEQGHLVVDDIEVMTTGFYSQRTVQLEASNYIHADRTDLRFTLYDQNNKRLYQSETSLSLINSKAEEQSETELAPYIDISSTSTYAIYYRRGAFVVRDDPENPNPGTPGLDETGTVADQMKNCKDPDITIPGTEGNNKGIWQTGKTYTKGNYVQYPDETGSWYVLTAESDGTSIAPGITWEWKCLTATFNATSLYEYGDIVIFNDKYYQVINITGSLAYNPTVATIWKGPMESVTEAEIEPAYGSCPIKP